MEPIFLRGSVGTASSLPQFMRERGNFRMSEGYDAMRSHGSLGLMIRVLGVLQDLPGMLMSRQVILFPVLFTDAVGV